MHGIILCTIQMLTRFKVDKNWPPMEPMAWQAKTKIFKKKKKKIELLLTESEGLD